MKRNGSPSNRGQSDQQGSVGASDNKFANNICSEFHDVHGFYGNGTCYVVDAESVHRFRECNVSLERIEFDLARDCCITDEVVVVFGDEVSAKQGIRALQRLIRTIRRNANRKSSKSGE